MNLQMKKFRIRKGVGDNLETRKLEWLWFVWIHEGIRKYCDTEKHEGITLQNLPLSEIKKKGNLQNFFVKDSFTQNYIDASISSKVPTRNPSFSFTNIILKYGWWALIILLKSFQWTTSKVQQSIADSQLSCSRCLWRQRQSRQQRQRLILAGVQ